MVHVVLNNFLGLSEFWDDADGDPDTRDACGPDAWLMTMHALYGLRLDADTLDGVRDDMKAHGLFGGGTTIGNLETYTRLRGFSVAQRIGWGLGLADQIHQALKEQTVARNGVILQVAAAHNLTGNEAGVGSHFVAVGGIDDTLGYLIGNGDDVNALASHGGHGKIIPTRWMGWNVLASALPTALLAIVGPDAGKPYTTNADGSLTYRAGTLGIGFSNYVRANSITDDLVWADYYYDVTHAACQFAAGTTLLYDAATHVVADGKAAFIVNGMRDALRARGVM